MLRANLLLLLSTGIESSPLEPPFPYRMRYDVDLELDERREAARRRLHNLGFSRSGILATNIRGFQQHYGYPVTGVLDPIEAALND